MNRIAGRAAVTLVFVLILIFGMLFFLGEYAVSSGDWVVFAGSPHVYNGTNIGTGTVTDRDGTVLLDMADGRTYASNATLRKAMLHWLGDRQGNISAPALSAYSREMAGFNELFGIYSYSGSNGTAVLTVSAEVQKAALEAMGSSKGCIAVYNYKTGEILCAVSTPNFDPDNVPDIANDSTGAYEGVYLNRFLQSSYPPGSIFKVITTTAALESIADIEDQTFVCTGSYAFGSEKVTCAVAHGTVTLKTAMSKSCNCAYAQIVEKMGGGVVNRYVEQLHVTEPVSFDGVTSVSGHFDLTEATSIDVAWAGIGQYTDLVNPCRFLMLMGQIAGGGRAAEPYIVRKVTCGDAVTYQASTKLSERIMSQDTAAKMTEYMRNNVQTNYGTDNFPGLTVCAKSGTAQLDGGKVSNAMFAGFVADEKYPLAFIAAVENAGYGSTVCVPILSQVLAACKNVMDGK